MKKLLAVILPLLIPASSFATTYYASTGGSGSTCSMGSPCTIGTGIGKLSGGDTLILNDGTYDYQIHTAQPPSGSMGAPTIIKAANSRMAIIKPTTVVAGGFGIIDIVLKNYITFDGIVEDGSTASIGNNDGFRLDDSDNIAIKNSEIRNNNLGASLMDCASAPNGVEITTTTGHHGMRNDLFTGNYVHDNGYLCLVDMLGEGLGFYVQESGIIIDGNIINNNQEAAVQLRNGSGDPAAGHDNIVRNNVMDGNFRTAIFVANYTVDAQIYNNVISNTSMYEGFGIDFYQNPANTLVYNNTIYSADNGCIRLDNSGGSAATNSVIKNNICWNTVLAIVDTGMGTVCSNNLNVMSCGSTLGSTDPLFVSPGTGNFHIQSGSPAIGIGANLCSTFCTDADGAARPAMGAWDAGAFIGPNPHPAMGGFFAF